MEWNIKKKKKKKKRKINNYTWLCEQYTARKYDQTNYLTYYLLAIKLR